MFGNAEAYERFMGRWSRLLAPLITDFAGISDQGPVLDIGSGTGALSFELARRRRDRRVTGVDLSTEYVSYAASKNPFPGRVTFETGDAQDLRFPSGTFAETFSSLVFNFISDPARALGEARRVTKPAGRITVAVWDYGEGMQMLRAFWDAAADTGDPEAEKLDEKHMRLCRAGELSHLWNEGGMQNVDEQPLQITMKFASFSDYWEPFLLGQGPAGAYVRKLDRDRMATLRAAVKKRLSVSSETAPFSLRGRVWAVRGDVSHLR
jgi:SAM-dependent methyltransferase